ncbi:MAG TPA: hypothetical protein DCO68_04780, partial [Methylophilaceae bacterium]|nr:hypothetical protein [Methylophilaceae bacterium]
MNKHVNDRMVIWSEWVIRKDDGNLGYPKECPYTRRIARSGGMGYQPNFNDDSIEIDRCLAKIKKDHPIIFRALHLF